ncbi:MAG TPA: hypothetical protein VJ770_27030 [Stellaceae bacterium]|nr:hypothetical protein [Stellaceae bacterium]
MTDRLDLTNAFEAAGIERKAAEHLAAEIFDAIRESVATKADLGEVRNELKADLIQFRTEVDGRLKLHNWMLTFVLAIQVAILFRVFWQ